MGISPDAPVSPRCASVDYLRLLAAVGIVWFHVMEAPGRVVAYAALPVFVILTILLPLMREESTPLRQTLRRRARRLLLPWAVWYAVYAGFAVRAGKPIVEADNFGSWLYGPALHLWFLPFAFLAGLIAEGLGRRMMRDPIVTVVVAPILGSALVWFAVGHLDHLDDPWVQFALAGSFAPFAIGLAATQRIEDAGLRRQAMILTALLPAVTATGMWHAGVNVSDAVSTALGVAAVVAVLGVRLPESAWVTRLAALTMGIYLIHPIALWAVYDFVSRPTWWMLVFGGVGGAAVASAFLHLHPWSRRLFFGESRNRRAAPIDAAPDGACDNAGASPRVVPV